MTQIQPRSHYLSEAAEFLRLAAVSAQTTADMDADETPVWQWQKSATQTRLYARLAEANISMAHALRNQI